MREHTRVWSSGGHPAAQPVPGRHPREDEDMPDLVTRANNVKHARADFDLWKVRNVEEYTNSSHHIGKHHPVNHLNTLVKDNQVLPTSYA